MNEDRYYQHKGGYMTRKRLMTNRGWRAASAVAAAVVVLAAAPAARASFCPDCNNSATVGDGIVFDELNVYGKPNPDAEGLRILNDGWVTMGDGTKAQLRVERHFLYAYTKSKTYSYDELVGMTFFTGVPDGRTYEVKLVAVKGCLHDRKLSPCAKKPENRCTPVTFWATPYEELPQYDFAVRKATQRTTPLPPNYPRSPYLLPLVDKKGNLVDKKGNLLVDKRGNLLKKEGRVFYEDDDRAVETKFEEHLCKGKVTEKDEKWDWVKNSAIVFDWDHYDRARKIVTEINPKEGWFNFACYGAAPAKMHLLRHTKAGGITTDGTDRKTTLPQRTAMLKAITADYCGDGKAWTGDGTPLFWTDAGGWFPKPPLNLHSLNTGVNNVSMIEAVWGEDGALCLNTPRRKPSHPGLTYAAGNCTAPAVSRDEVKAACASVGRKFKGPPASLTPSTSTSIPECNDPSWLNTWPSAKNSGGKVHVITARDHTDPSNYCDVPPVTPPSLPPPPPPPPPPPGPP